eukprot:TRINITY_DN56922_c0_g1_i1.p1 TRINITY_DN56922_c0_g1~~TRINITY_DN56922_c0_g1_i1.p1  ORF type:complete len:285 (-),score=49.02 TRINITY_DN56922_c0_g1_i1:29-883(-)
MSGARQRPVGRLLLLVLACSIASVRCVSTRNSQKAAGNEARPDSQAPKPLGALSAASCSALLNETYGALQGWAPSEGPFRHMCVSMMVMKLHLAKNAAAAKAVCAAFATTAVAAKRKYAELPGGQLPALSELKAQWCSPAPAEPPSALDKLRKLASSAHDRISSVSGWISQRSNASVGPAPFWAAASAGTADSNATAGSGAATGRTKRAVSALIEVFPSKMVPGSSVALAAADLAAYKGDSMLQGGASLASSLRDGFWNTLNFLCDDRCGLRAHPKPNSLRIVG